ncbi:uncharacterized protein LOC123443068 isoform X2 [Hordeum vulgare subsp. vulgare]|nr:uncharacterized protein LOC123443068 isoform X2 [Hordeum vulgare subsp. vulgare]
MAIRPPFQIPIPRTPRRGRCDPRRPRAAGSDDDPADARLPLPRRARNFAPNSMGSYGFAALAALLLAFALLPDPAAAARVLQGKEPGSGEGAPAPTLATGECEKIGTSKQLDQSSTALQNPETDSIGQFFVVQNTGQKKVTVGVKATSDISIKQTLLPLSNGESKRVNINYSSPNGGEALLYIFQAFHADLVLLYEMRALIFNTLE